MLESESYLIGRFGQKAWAYMPIHCLCHLLAGAIPEPSRLVRAACSLNTAASHPTPGLGASLNEHHGLSEGEFLRQEHHFLR